MFCRLAVAPPARRMRRRYSLLLMKPRFEPDNESSANDGLSPTLIDPEAYDASEQTFAASLEQTVVE